MSFDKCAFCDMVDFSGKGDCMVCSIMHDPNNEVDNYGVEIELGSSRYVITHDGEVFTAVVAVLEKNCDCKGVWTQEGIYMDEEEIASFVIGKPIKPDFDRTFGEELGGYLYAEYIGASSDTRNSGGLALFKGGSEDSKNSKN